MLTSPTQCLNHACAKRAISSTTRGAITPNLLESYHWIKYTPGPTMPRIFIHLHRSMRGIGWTTAHHISMVTQCHELLSWFLFLVHWRWSGKSFDWRFPNQALKHQWSYYMQCSHRGLMADKTLVRTPNYSMFATIPT